jgi:hypothetical protein
MRGARYRSCLLLLVAGLLVVPLPAAADGPPAGVIVWGCRSGADPAPCNVPAAAATGVTAIAAGLVHSLALKLDGSVIAWGCPASDDYGQCTVPAAVRSGVTAISAGLAHSLAVKKGGVIAWGCKGAAFGDPTDDGQCTVPAAAASGVTAVAAGASHSLALRKDGRVVAWGCAGSADRGQCTVPAAARSGVTAIAAGLFHSLALKNGGVLAWGCDRSGVNPAPCTVPAAAAGGVSAIAAAGLSLSLFAHLEQTITVVRHAPPKATYKQSFTVAASSSSGLPVAYGSSGACSNAGASFTMKSGTGRCRVRYDQPGGGSFGTARVVESVSARKAAQRIRFGALAGKTYGTADFRVRASASSGLRVSFAARGSCTVRGTTVHITSAGSCTLTASQRGNANYNAAASVSQSFTIARGTP